MWNALRDRRFRGVKFRREHVLHPFIVDFYAASQKLVVEIDGGYHATRTAEDAARTAMLEHLHGVRVIRFDSHRVEHDVRAVLAELAAAFR